MATQDTLPIAIQKYFEHLENGEFAAAAEQFTEDCTYIHPPSYQETITVEGRSELVKYFQNRGDQDIAHDLERILVGEERVSFVGHQTGDDTGDDYFISFAELEDDMISYYIAGFVKGETVSK